MHGKQLTKKFALDSDELDQLVSDAMGGVTMDSLDDTLSGTVARLTTNEIVHGKVIRVQEDGMVVVDVGYKSEGRIPIDEFDDPESVITGLEIETLIEEIVDVEGHIALSKRKADRIRGWERVI